MHEDESRDTTGEASSTDRVRRRRFLGAVGAALGSPLVTGATGATPYGGSRHAIPGRIQAEDYDTDGAGAAYNDTTSGNTGGAYRSGDVDIEAMSGGGYNVGWTDTGEWLNYSATVDTAGTYEVTARVASGDGGGRFILEQDQNDLATYDVPDTGGWQSWTTITKEVTLDGGDRVIAVYFDTAGVNLDWLDFSLVSDDGGGDEGFSAYELPATVQAEGYMRASDSTAGNEGGAYRDGDVDIESTTDPQGSDYNVGWITSGEWLEYDVSVPEDGTFAVGARVASNDGGGGLTVEVDGTARTSASFGATGGWQSWTTASVGTVSLSAGTHTLRVVADESDWNFNFLAFEAADTGGGEQSAYADHAFPGLLQAEDYDTGGQDVAYNDTTDGNEGGAYRSDDVDIAAGASGYNVGWIETGEWYEYTVDVSEGTYELAARVASNASGGAFRVEVDGTDVTGTVSVPDTGGWQAWTTTTASDVSLAGGQQVVRIVVEDGGFNLDWLEATEGGGQSGDDNYPSLDDNSWELVWRDEFDAGSIDYDSWTDEVGGGCGENASLDTDCSWGNQEEQYYTDGDNAWVENDRLLIEAREETAPNGENPYTSARLSTDSKFEQEYGRVEVRARLPETQGLWPAIWMLGGDISSVSWPTCGEIDIMELLGDDPTTVHGTMHGPGYSGAGGIGKSYSGPDFSSEFHDFQITWYPDAVKWFVDGQHYHTVTKTQVENAGNEWVFDNPFFVILNVAVGGVYPGYTDSRTQLPQRMEVEYVRVYDYV